jgi:hypothetical protein
MAYQSLKKLRALCLVLLVLGVVSAAVAYSYQRSKAVKYRPAKGFTIVTKETISLNDPKEQSEPGQADYVITTRYQKSDGTWKEVRTRHESTGEVIKEQIQFGIPGNGVYEVDNTNGTLQFISSMPPAEQTSYVAVVDGRDHPKYLKDDVVQGYRTYVLHYEVDENGSYEDEYYAPELDGFPIKTLKFAPHGSSVTEMIQLTPGNPDESVFSSLPNWFVDYDAFHRKIKALESEGHHQAAAGMKRQLEKAAKGGQK